MHMLRADSQSDGNHLSPHVNQCQLQSNSDMIIDEFPIPESSDVKSSESRCLQFSIQDSLQQQNATRSLDIVRDKPTRSISNEAFCQRIANANRMIAVGVRGDGSCQHNAVVECLRRANYIEELNVDMLRQRVYIEVIYK
jgi:hypothetical protein